MGIFDERRQTTNSGADNSEAEDQYAYMKRNRTSSILIFVVIVIAYIIYSYFGANACGGETTTGRVKLATENFVLLDSWYDKASAYTDSEVANTMITFYESSGVQPFVLVVDDETSMTVDELDSMAEDYYRNELFAGSASSDEGHMVIAFQTTTGLAGIYTGTEAGTVIDADARGTFRTILSSCYNKYSGNKVLTNTFKQAAGKIMGRSKSSIYIIIALAIICVVYFVWNFRKTSKNYQNGQTGGSRQ